MIRRANLTDRLIVCVCVWLFKIYGDSQTERETHRQRARFLFCRRVIVFLSVWITPNNVIQRNNKLIKQHERNSCLGISLSLSLPLYLFISFWKTHKKFEIFINSPKEKPNLAQKIILTCLRCCWCRCCSFLSFILDAENKKWRIQYKLMVIVIGLVRIDVTRCCSICSLCWILHLFLECFVCKWKLNNEPICCDGGCCQMSMWGTKQKLKL